jgi:hypothetical protein
MGLAVRRSAMWPDGTGQDPPKGKPRRTTVVDVLRARIVELEQRVDDLAHRLQHLEDVTREHLAHPGSA